MRKIKIPCIEETLEPVIADSVACMQVTKELCEKALTEAKAHLHPLLRSEELDSLDRRCEFVQAFKRALEEGIAWQLAFWQPCIQAVFQFSDAHPPKEECWDNTIHLLVIVAQPLNTMKALGPILDRNLVDHLKQLNWSRFRMRESIVEIQQVTPDEVRIGIGYGAMFSSVYNAPVKVWPQRRQWKKHLWSSREISL